MTHQRSEGAMTKPTGETPRTDALAEGYAPECWDKTPYESMRDLARALERQLSERDAELRERDDRIAVLEKALRECREDLVWLRDNREAHPSFTDRGFSDRLAAIDRALATEQPHE